MTVIEQALELQRKYELKERFEREFFEGCVKAGIISVLEIEEKKGKFDYLNKFFKINNSSISLYNISNSRSEKVDTEKELEERLSYMFKVLSKKMIESIPVAELYRSN
ncbi:hypothetical protein V3H21_17925 [Vibrio parahaemolyticus]|uniref:hypothetical protein n=1 Tax=Vibrio parahaemolyticus TaxID=670 RepID=UPI00186AACE8|nr:hypothetical protein [Vibrio parahaemolyticus]HCG6537992.1 hypothetical protein [Vibrio parahaemolyticus]HCH0791327.1 hypothetical protein [Vibrio parahaemolyticus]